MRRVHAGVSYGARRAVKREEGYRSVRFLPWAVLLALPLPVQAQSPDQTLLQQAVEKAEKQLHQTFTNLRFEDFGPAPVEGPIYQAIAGGKIIYFAPQSEHLLFATVYDRNGVNLTALAQEQGAARLLKAIDPTKALVIGPSDAPTVIEFTDPDCPYCQALDRFWKAKAAEGKPVRRLIFFVSGIHRRRRPRRSISCARPIARQRSRQPIRARPRRCCANALRGGTRSRTTRNWSRRSGCRARRP